MVEKWVVEYIKNSMPSKSIDEITKYLLKQGLSDSEINEALELAILGEEQKANDVEEVKEEKIKGEESKKEEKGRRQRKIVYRFVLVIFIFVLILFAFVYWFTNIKRVDCKTDVHCFVKATKNCRPAEFVLGENFTKTGISRFVRIVFSLDRQGKLCRLSAQLTNVSLSFTDEQIEYLKKGGKTEEEIAKIIEGLEKAASEQRDGTCVLDTITLNSIFLEVEKGRLFQDALRKVGEMNCTGSIFELGY